MRGMIRIVLGLAAISVLLAGCSTDRTVTGPAGPAAGVTASAAVAATPAAGNINGRAGDMPAYYDSMLVTINFREFAAGAETKLLEHNTGVNKIFQSDPGLPGGAPFISVLDAIQGDGFNPLWEEWQITFTAGHTPRQLFSDNEVFAAQASGEITLTDTDELYRCSVVGPKK